MSTRHLIAAAALAALGTAAFAQQDTTRMDTTRPSANSHSDMQGMHGMQTKAWGDDPPVIDQGEAGVTQQPMSDPSLTRSEVQKEAQETLRAPDESDVNLYNGAD